jgi:putative aldouronate transport system permease protein
MTEKNRSFDIVSVVLSVIIIFFSIYPFYYILVLSFNSGLDARSGGIYFWPREFTLENYRQVLTDNKWARGFLISTLRTVTGMTVSVFFTSIFAYAISVPGLRFKGFYRTWMIVAMYVYGGIIPTYMVYKTIGIINSFFVYIIPSAIDYFFVLIFISHYKSIPPSLREAALIDGAGESHIFFRIILGVSKPVLATWALFSGVTQWNAYFDAVIFVQNSKLKPLSYLLVEVLNKSSTSQFTSAAYARRLSYTTQSLQMACVVIAIIPIVAIYPFLQKYFSKGIMLGAVKE